AGRRRGGSSCARTGACAPAATRSSSPRTRAAGGASARAVRSASVDHAVDQAVVARLVGHEEAVALHVLVDAFAALAGVQRVELVEARAQGERLARVDLDVRRLALEAAGRLVDEDAPVGQRHAVARLAG